MRHCLICWQECKPTAKYCLKCSSLLRDNRTRAINIKKKIWSKLCPICFRPISEHDTFCGKCNTTLHERKQILFTPFKMTDKEDILNIEYEYLFKEPKFFRRNRKDYVTYKVIDTWLKVWHKLTQNLEILYKEWLPKRNRFQSKEKYFTEFIEPIAREQYKRWRLNQIWFLVDVAVEEILNGKKIEENDWQKTQ